MQSGKNTSLSVDDRNGLYLLLLGMLAVSLIVIKQICRALRFLIDIKRERITVVMRDSGPWVFRTVGIPDTYHFFVFFDVFEYFVIFESELNPLLYLFRTLQKVLI